MTTMTILFTLDSAGNKSGGFDYHTGEVLPLEVCDRIFTDVYLNYKEGQITHIGSTGTLTTYLVEVL